MADTYLAMVMSTSLQLGFFTAGIQLPLQLVPSATQASRKGHRVSLQTWGHSRWAALV